jgi:hypothetical protein
MSERVWVVYDAEGQPRMVADNAETAKNYAIGGGTKDVREFVSAGKIRQAILDANSARIALENFSFADALHCLRLLERTLSSGDSSGT